MNANLRRALAYKDSHDDDRQDGCRHPGRDGGSATSGTFPPRTVDDQTVRTVFVNNRDRRRVHEVGQRPTERRLVSSIVILRQHATEPARAA